MSKHSSDLVRAAGVLSSFTIELIKRTSAMSVPEQRVHAALTDPMVVDQIAQLVANCDSSRYFLDPMSLSVVFSLSDRLAAREFAQIDPEIWECAADFRGHKMDIPREYYVVDPHYCVDFGESLRLLESRGLRPATFVELILLAVDRPTLGTDYQIYALDHDGFLTRRSGTGVVMGLGPLGSAGRGLWLQDIVGKQFPVMARFLAVPR